MEEQSNKFLLSNALMYYLVLRCEKNLMGNKKSNICIVLCKKKRRQETKKMNKEPKIRHNEGKRRKKNLH